MNQAENNSTASHPQAQQIQDRLKAYDQSINVTPDNPELHFHKGTFLHGLGRYPEALESYCKAIEIKPDYSEAYSNKGVILRALNRLDEALASYDQAIALQPDFSDVYNNRGNLLKQMGRLDESLASYHKAIELKPDLVDSYLNRAGAYKALKNLDAALTDYNYAIALKLDYAASYSSRGALLKEMKRLDEALNDFDQAIALDPNSAVGYSNRGAVLREMKRLDEALVSYAKALSLNPNFADAYSNRGNALVEMERLDEALSDHQKAIALRPSNAGFYYNCGVALYELGRIDEALLYYAKALELKPDYDGVHWNESIARLLIGDFERGWQKYESRWQRDEAPKRKFRQPLWLGSENLQGKTILLYTEQGFGDAIQFCRYAKLVAEQGARVILEVREPLQKLLGSLEGVSQIIIRGHPLPAFDYQCPLLSLPLAFHTQIETIPNQIPYLWADAEKIKQWSSRLGEKNKPRVGLVWSGSPTHKNDHNRSLSLESFLRIMPEHVQLYSLQKEVRDSDQETLKKHPEVMNFSAFIEDFSDTAALIAQMDLIISVDTSVAHLAAALGKPVWILLPKIPDWRWLLDRNDNPWYPQVVQLFRQAQRGDWAGVLSRIQQVMYSWSVAAWHTLGISALREKHINKGIYCIQKTLELDPRNALAHFNLGHAYRLSQRWEGAVSHYNQAMELKPDLRGIAAYRSVALQQLLTQLNAKLECDEKKLPAEVDLSSIYYNRGFVFQMLDNLEAAAEDYKKTIALKPDYLIAYNNYGTVLRQLNRIEEAVWIYGKAIEIKSDYASAHWNLATCQLLLGDFSQGWKSYEWRWAVHPFMKRSFAKPRWFGTEDIHNKTLLLYGEQGLGDVIQFCRYVSLVAERGARIILEVPEVLVALMKNLMGVSEVISQGQPLPAFDYHTSLLSLPLALNTELETIPKQIPYVFPSEEKIEFWKDRLGEKDKPRIGLVWSGSLLHRQDKDRSIALEQLLEIYSDAMQWYSLQKEIREVDQVTLSNHPKILHFENEIKDFSDTGALISQMDLIISVDTSVVHLAGALGKPIWVLLPFAADWRWLLDRSDSPWYPSARLFRQSQRGDWHSVLLEVASGIKTYTASL